MFTLAGLIPLLIVIYVRPQEFLPALQGVPLLHLFSLITVVGLALDHRLGYARVRLGPLFIAAVAFFGWGEVTLAAAARPAFVSETMASFTPFFLFVALAQGVQSFRSVKAVALTLVGLTLFLTVIALHQKQGPMECHRPEQHGKDEIWVSDGRGCETRTTCFDSALDDDVVYRCEHVGLLGTSSIEGRVKYRGIMEDPNELALVMAASLSLVFALVALNPSGLRLSFTVAAFLAIGVCTVFTQSRSGQLAFLAVIAIYMLRRLKWAGLGLAALAAGPVLLLGGRSDAKADSSSMERLEAWLEGIHMWTQSPVWGVGKGQFADHHWITAHNSFVLMLGEQGTVGVFIWTAVQYMAFKTLLTIARREKTPPASLAQTWANSLTAALCAVLVSAFFLSFAYHNVFWIYLGLVASVHAATQRHDPELRVSVRGSDLAWIAFIDGALTAAIYLYARIKGA